MRLLTSPAPPDMAPWRRARGPLAGKWLRVMGARPPGRLVCFTLVDDSGEGLACTTGYVVTDPDCYAPFNWYDLLWTPAGVFSGQRPVTAGAGPPRRDCFPALNLVQPGYEFTVEVHERAGSDVAAWLIDEVVEWARGRALASVVVLYADPVSVPLFDGGDWLGVQGCDRALLPLAGYDPTVGFGPQLASRNARRQVRADLRVLAANRVIIAGAEVASDLAELLRLREQLVGKYGSYTSRRADERHLRRLVEVYGETGLRLFVARSADGHAMLGFSLFRVADPATWSAFWVGSRHDLPTADRVYFGCLFYAPVEAALRAGVRLIDYGPECDPAKKRRGCLGEPRPVFLRSLTSKLSGTDLTDHPRILDSPRLTGGH